MYIVVECSDNSYFGVVNTDNMEYKVLDREKFSGLLRSTEVFNWDKNGYKHGSVDKLPKIGDFINSNKVFVLSRKGDTDEYKCLGGNGKIQYCSDVMLNAFYNGGRLINANASRRNTNASAGFIIRLNRGELQVEDLSDNEKLKSAMNLVNSERVFTAPREHKLDSNSLTQITSIAQLFTLSEEDSPSRSMKGELNEFNGHASAANTRYDDLAINFIKTTAANEDIAEWAIGAYINAKADLGYLKKGFIVDIKDTESGSLIKAEDTLKQYKYIRYFPIIQCIFKNIQSYKGDSSKISEKEGIVLRTIQWLLKFTNMATDVINSDNNKVDKTLGYAGASVSFKSLYTLLIIALGRDILYNDDSMYKYLNQAIDAFDKSRNDFSRAEMNEKPKDSMGKTVKTEKKGFLGKLNSLFNM